MKSRYSFLILVILSSLFFSCSDFLDEGPESKIPGDRIFEDAKTTNGYIIGLYKEWRELKHGRVDPYLGTDEAVAGGFQYMDNNDRKGVEGYGNTLNSTNGIIRWNWEMRCRIMSRAAEAIFYLKKGEESQSDELNRYLGESAFLRAICTWELSMFYGPVILHDKENPDLEFARQPLEVVYEQIISDLLLAEKYLKDPADERDYGRVNKATAQTLLGKVYLYAPENSGLRDYAKAAEYFKKVVENPYYQGTGAETYESIFDSYGQESDNHRREMIYALQYKVGWPYNNANEWELGSRAVAQMTPGEAMAPWSGFDAIMPSIYAYTMEEDGGVWEEGDLRKDESIRYNFEWTDPEDKHYVPDLTGWTWGDELEPHIKKYEDLRIVDAGYSTYHCGKNIPILRYSDAVLCYAECLYFTGKQAEGINLVNNVVRTRAFGGSLPADKRWNTGMGKEEFVEKILDERMRELCFEGWRKYDLLRTGKTIEYVTERNRWHSTTEFVSSDGTREQRFEKAAPIQEFKLTWPIPLDELIQNPGLSEADQNPGYEN